MKKIIGIIVIVLLIPVVIVTLSDIDKTPIYPTTEFNIEKLTRISSIDIENGIELLKMPSGVGDRWLSDGKVERNVGNVVVVGLENWERYGYQETSEWQTIAFRTFIIENSGVSATQTTTAISSHFLQRRGLSDNPDEDRECFFITGAGYLYVRIFKSRLDNFDEDWIYTEKVNAFKFWLSQNTLTVYYQLAEPIIETASILPNFIDFYDGGSVIVDDGIIDYTVVGNQAQINYVEGNITTVEDGQFNISKPTKIISKSNNLYEYDLSNLPNYLEYGILTQDTYNNTLELINNNQNKQIKIFFDDNIQDSRYNIYLENDVIIIINNDTEVIRIYNDNSYTSTRNLDTNITYKLEGYHVIDYIDGKFDNTVLAFFWVIPTLLVGGLIYLMLKRKE